MHQLKPSRLPVSWSSEFGKNGLLRVSHKIHAATRKYYPNLLDKVRNDTKVVQIRNKSEYQSFLMSVKG